MLKVRLQRTGKRGQAYFRVVVLEHTKKPKGKFLELLGSYDPHKKEFKVNMERINHRVSNGAQVSPTVNNLLVNYKYWDKPKVKSWKPKKGQDQSTKDKSSATKTKEQKVETSTTEQSKQEKETAVESQPTAH